MSAIRNENGGEVKEIERKEKLQRKRGGKYEQWRGDKIIQKRERRKNQ